MTEPKGTGSKEVALSVSKHNPDDMDDSELAFHHSIGIGRHQVASGYDVEVNRQDILTNNAKLATHDTTLATHTSQIGTLQSQVGTLQNQVATLQRITTAYLMHTSHSQVIGASAAGTFIAYSVGVPAAGGFGYNNSDIIGVNWYAPYTGIWLINLTTQWSANGTGGRGCSIMANGQPQGIGARNEVATASAGWQAVLKVSYANYFNAGTSFNPGMWQNSPGNLLVDFFMDFQLLNRTS